MHLDDPRHLLVDTLQHALLRGQGGRRGRLGAGADKAYDPTRLLFKGAAAQHPHTSSTETGHTCMVASSRCAWVGGSAVQAVTPGMGLSLSQALALGSTRWTNPLRPNANAACGPEAGVVCGAAIGSLSNGRAIMC